MPPTGRASVLSRAMRIRLFACLDWMLETACDAVFLARHHVGALPDRAVQAAGRNDRHRTDLHRRDSDPRRVRRRTRAASHVAAMRDGRQQNWGADQARDGASPYESFFATVCPTVSMLADSEATGCKTFDERLNLEAQSYASTDPYDNNLGVLESPIRHPPTQAITIDTSGRPDCGVQTCQVDQLDDADRPAGASLPVAPSILSWVEGTPAFSRRVSL